MILFSADIRQAQACSDDAITTSSVGIPVKLILASDFNGLAKTVVFRNGTASADVALVGDATETTVPVNVLVTTGQLRIGIYAADGNGTIVIPTVWAMAGIVKQGVVPSGVDPSDPVPNWVAQVQSIASQASEDASDALTIAQGVKAQADAGDFDGAPGQDGTDGTDGYSPTVSVEEIPGGHEVTITDINGEHSFEVLDGQGGGGSSDYNDLSNKPQIAGTTLSGNKSLADLGIAAASDIPAVPVQSVNSKTGAVVLDASDVGALPYDTTIPTKTSQLDNDSGFLTSAPVTSVNSKTGAVSLSASDVGALPDSTTIPSASSATPQALGTASAGSSSNYSRADHVHTKPSASDVGAVAVAQGISHAGEFCVVGSDGNITTVTMTAWAGGSY